ncbi:kinase-like domain-containing protein [Mycena olivaceomarginata]|nr:kinase-like domain-containing protein [Mycena olivaceomarginata]
MRQPSATPYIFAPDAHNIQTGDALSAFCLALAKLDVLLRVLSILRWWLIFIIVSNLLDGESACGESCLLAMSNSGTFNVSRTVPLLVRALPALPLPLAPRPGPRRAQGHQPRLNQDFGQVEAEDSRKKKKKLRKRESFFVDHGDHWFIIYLVLLASFIVPEIASLAAENNIRGLIRLAEAHDIAEKGILLELCMGGNLADHLAAESLNEEEAQKISYQIAQAIQYLHQKQIGHGDGKQFADLKPENVLLWKREKNPRILLSDFGLAKWRCVSSTVNACGTCEWMSPQALAIVASATAGNVQTRRANDCWALGILISVIICNRHPFIAETAYIPRTYTVESSEMGRRVRETAPRMDELPEGAVPLVLGLLQGQEEDRLTIYGAMELAWLGGAQVPLWYEEMSKRWVASRGDQ